MDVFSRAKCSDENREILSPERMRALGIPPTELYANVSNIIALATAERQAGGRDFLLLPFCHTVEAKAMGAIIQPADETAGPRPGAYTLSAPCALRPVEIAAHLDVRQLLDACTTLTQGGAQVVYQLSGPISILSCLMDLSALFKDWRKSPRQVQDCLDSIRAMLLDYAQALCGTGIAWISYADPAGSPDILGPKYTALLNEWFTLPFLKELSQICGTRCTLLICPLTAAALATGEHLRTVAEGGDLAVRCVKRGGCTVRKTAVLS